MFFWLSKQLIGRAKRDPHWGVQSRFRVIHIYVSVGRYVCRVQKYIGGITWPKHVHAQSQIWATYDTCVIHFDYRISLNRSRTLINSLPRIGRLVALLQSINSRTLNRARTSARHSIMATPPCFGNPHKRNCQPLQQF